MRKQCVVMLMMLSIAGFTQSAYAYGYGYERPSVSVVGGIVAGLVGGFLLGSAIAAPPAYAGPPPMYGAPVPVYAPPPYDYAGPRCYWRNVQEWVGYGWAMVPRQICY